MVAGRGIFHTHGVHIPEDAHIGSILWGQAIGKVDDLTHLTFLEQGRVAGAVYLLHLPAHGRKHERVFTGGEVRGNLHALAQGLHRGIVLVAAARMTDHLLALGAVGVQVVIHQPRRVVALQGEHNRQRVAQVVLRQVIQQRLAALLVAADHAAGQPHLRGVVEIDASHVARDVLLAGVLIPAVVREHVIIHHSLNGVVTLHQAEGETAVVVGLHEVALGVVDLPAVDEEVDTLHRDARAVVHHEARETLAAGDDELVHSLVVARGVEGHRVGIHLQTENFGGHRLHLVIYSRLALVRQLVAFEVAALVGPDARHLLSIIDDVHLDIGSARAVVVAHVALQAAGVLTLAGLLLSLAGADALAVVNADDLIFIRGQWRHAGVLVAQLVDIGGYLFPRIVALAFDTALHDEVVDGVAVSVPAQQHAALARLRQQLRIDGAGILVVEEPGQFCC